MEKFGLIAVVDTIPGTSIKHSMLPAGRVGMWSEVTPLTHLTLICEVK